MHFALLRRQSPLFVSLIVGALFGGSSTGFGQDDEFRRGDSNTDSRIDVSDPVFTLLFLFAGGTDPRCMDATDANDDGVINVSDPLRLLSSLFMSGPPLEGASDGCGGDTTDDDALGCADYPHCAQPPQRVVTQVVLEPDLLEVSIGETGVLEATAFDENGEVVEGAPIFFVSGSSGLTVSTSGEVTSNLIGFHSVVAFSGDVTSEPVTVIISHPRGQEVASMNGFVEPSGDGVVPQGRVLSPSESTEVAPDGSFSVERLRFRNQILFALDDTTDDVLWLAVAPGATGDDEAPESVRLGPLSTAEALLFLVPGVSHPDPSVFADFRSAMEDDPGLLELATTIESLGPEWPAHMDEIGHILDTILRSLGERLIDRLENQPLDGEGGGAGGSEFEPTVHPPVIGGIEVIPIQRSTKRLVDLKIVNHLVRQVDIYLEKVLGDGSRPPASQARGPFQMGSSTFLLPSLGQLFTFNGSFSTQELIVPEVDFDPKRGGSRQWRVFAYGLGFRERLHPDLPRDRLEDRLGLVVFRSLVLDLLANGLSILTTIDAKPLAEVVTGLRLSMVASASFQALVATLSEKQPVADIVAALVDFGVDFFIDVIESGRFKKALAKVALKEVIEKFAVLLEIYSLLSSASELIGFGVALASCAPVEIIRIDDGPGHIEPEEGRLPDGHVDCPYEVEFRMVGDEGPFSWEIEGAGELFESLVFTPVGGPEFRTASLTTSEFLQTGRIDFRLVVKAPIDPRDPTELREVAGQRYSIKVKSQAPSIEEVDFPMGEFADPGGTIGVDVDVAYCVGIEFIAGGTVTGAALTAPVPLLPPASAVLTGTLTVDKPEQDKPLDPTVGDVTVTVKDTSGGAVSTQKKIYVRNVAPSTANGTSHLVAPGGSFTVEVEAQDDNEDGTRQEVFSSAVRLTHPVPLKSNPSLDKLEYRRVNVKPSTGQMTFRAKSAATVELPHADNDGTTEDPADDAPFRATVKLFDDDSLPVTTTTPVEVVVKNVAPVVDVIMTTPAILPAVGTVAVRPLDIEVHVLDDNGHSDVDSVELDLTSLGLAESIILSDPVSLDPDGRGASYMFHIDNVEANCTAGCPIIAQAKDKDDAESNGGLSAATSVVLPERNVPPVIGGDAILEPIGPTGANRCPGDPMLFAVMASDQNRNILAADLILDGMRIPLPPSPDSKNIWKLIVAAPAPGVHRYSFEIREIDVFHGALTTTTALRDFEVDDCSVTGSPPECPPELIDEEICDGVDNDCDGEIDEIFQEPCTASLHSGQYIAKHIPICPGSSILYRVVVQGTDHPYPARVEWSGPENGDRALEAEKDEDGSFTGYYQVRIKASSTPGEYTITFHVQVPALELELSYPLRVPECCTITEAQTIGTGGAAVAVGDTGAIVWSGGSEGEAEAGLHLFNVADCSEVFHAIENPLQIDSLTVAGGWVSWIDFRNVTRSQAFVMGIGDRTELLVGPSGSNQVEVALDAPHVLVTDDRDGKPNLYRHTLLSPGESTRLTDNTSLPGARFSPVVASGLAFWVGADFSVRKLDLSSEDPVVVTVVTEAPAPLGGLDASGGRLVWAAESPADGFDIVVVDVASGEFFTFPSSSLTEPVPGIAGDSVVWEKTTSLTPFETSVAHLDLGSEVTTNLSEDVEGVNTFPDVGSGFVSWLNSGEVHVTRVPGAPLVGTPDSFDIPPGVLTTLDVAENDVFLSGTSFELVNPPALHDDLFEWNGDGTFSIALLTFGPAVVNFSYKLVRDGEESEEVLVTITGQIFLAISLDPVVDPNTGEATVGAPTVVLGGAHVPIYQLILANSPADVCSDPHWHADFPVASLEGSPGLLQDPNPSSCGFGTFENVEQAIVTISASVWFKFLESHPPSF